MCFCVSEHEINQAITKYNFQTCTSVLNYGLRDYVKALMSGVTVHGRYQSFQDFQEIFSLFHSSA